MDLQGVGRPLTRRTALLGGLSLGALLAGCGGGAAPAAAPAAAGSGFPRSVATSRGPVEIAARPERIVTLAADVDPVVAVGRMPTAMAQSNNVGNGIDPWLAGRVDPGTVTLFPASSTVSVPYETVAAAQPQVIFAGTHFPIDEDYPQLAAIAPTVTTVRGLTEDTWQEQTRLVGQALGAEGEAEAVVAAVEARIAETRAAHPDWAQKTFATAFGYQSGSVRAAAAGSFGPRFLESLGLRVSPGVAALTSPDLSIEQLGILDADVLLMTYSSPERQAEVEASPLFRALPAVQAGRVITIDLPTSTALTVPSVLRVGYVLDTLVPQLDAALGR